jgi:hypothetical protein
MKTLITICFLLFANLCIAQEQSNDSNRTLNIPFIPATIHFLADTGSIASSFINKGLQKITYTKVPIGKYKIQMTGQGQLTTIIDSIYVTNNKLVLNINITGPCLYDHPIAYVPTCPKNHQDSIISIVYGLVTKSGDTFIKDKKDLKVKYAGCVMTGCDPQYYCKLHDIEF